jgi:alanine dehydrogenase
MKIAVQTIFVGKDRRCNRRIKMCSQALKDDVHNGLNVWNRKITRDAVAKALGYEFVSAETALA